MAKSGLWWMNGVVYQIYPRSFSDSNGDGIGDLIGIVDKLDYLADLGIDAIWLSPSNPSRDVDFGYYVADYRDIDPKYGTLADFDPLLTAAHERGIRVIVDLVLNHSSAQHSWFIESRSSVDNPKRDWYIWRDGKAGRNAPPNDWQATFGGKAWEYDEASGQYYYHMFCKEQPDLNWRNPEVYAEMMDTFRFWADRGVDGFRLDVFNQYFKDEYFRENPKKLGIRPFDWQNHVYDTNRPEMQGVVADIRAVLDAYPERYAVGETFMPTPEMAASYCGPGKLHATFDFSMVRSPWNPERYLGYVLRQEESLPEGAWPNYVLNNHDNPRSATRLNAPRDDERLKVAAAMLLTLRGTPFMYYGEEIGMRDIRVSRSEVRDPVGKRYWPLPVGRDGCRSPMQWNAEENAGFSSGNPWLKLHPDYARRNVAAQQADPKSLFNFYRSLLHLRRSYPALHSGSFTPLKKNPQRVLGYLRKEGRQTILIILNFTAVSTDVQLGDELAQYKWELLLSNKERSQPVLNDGSFTLQGNEACILIKKMKRQI